MAENVRFRYMIDTKTSKGHYVFYRETRGNRTLKYDIWNSVTKQWNPSATACDAFSGMDVFADDISEKEVLDIINCH